MAMIRLSGRLVCPTHTDARRVAMALPAHVRLTQAEAGCIAFDVSPTADPLVWTVDETFASRAAFDAHQQGTAASDWAAQTKDITRDYVITEESAEAPRV